MDPQLRAGAETLLEAAATDLDLQDPRAPYRERLRLLKDTHNEAFRSAVAHYEAEVLPALADAADPLEVWVEYGRYLGSLTSDGRLTTIDATGRARAYAPPLERAELVLFIPDDDRADVLIALQPQTPTDAQRAAIDLLVNRQLALRTE